MKNYYLSLVIVVLFSITSNAQTHILKYDCPVIRCDINGKPLDKDGKIVDDISKAESLIASEGSKLDSIQGYAIGSTTNNYVRVEFTLWIPPSPKATPDFTESQLNKINDFNYSISTDKTADRITYANNIYDNYEKMKPLRKYFLISNDNFKSLAVSRASSKFSFNAGTLFIPLKIRPRPFDAEGNISLAATGAAGYAFCKAFTSYITFAIGLSSITIDSSNTQGKTKKNTSLSATTLSPGIVFSFGRVQVDANIGWDILNNSDASKGWIYNGKWWLGIGIGFQLFNPSSGTTAPKGDPTQSNSTGSTTGSSGGTTGKPSGGK